MFIKLCVCASFPFDFEGGMCDLIVLVPGHCISFNLEFKVILS